MAQEFPLQILLDLSQLQLDEAARRLGEFIASEQEATQRLDMLVQYREEYRNRFLAAAKDGINLDAWRNYRAFLDRLDAAVSQANELVLASQRRTSAGQEEWLKKRGKVNAFDTLAQRHQARLDYAEQRREQKASDEHTATRHKKA
ncbi:MAG: flagellar export protein FliJ, partial [Ignavibacteria bacterium]